MHYMNARVCACMHPHHSACGDQRTTFGNYFSPSTMGPRSQTWHQACAQELLPTEPSHRLKIAIFLDRMKNKLTIYFLRMESSHPVPPLLMWFLNENDPYRLTFECLVPSWLTYLDLGAVSLGVSFEISKVPSFQLALFCLWLSWHVSQLLFQSHESPNSMLPFISGLGHGVLSL